MEVFFVRHQQRGVLHDKPFATREEAEKAAEAICIVEKARPSWLKPSAEWWCARVYEPASTPPAVGERSAPAAALPELAFSGVGVVTNPKE